VALGSRLIADMLALRYARFIGLYATGRILDHGCGQSPMLGMYRDKCTEIIGVDWTGSPHDTAYADIYADLNDRLPFEDAYFDTVLSSDVVEHLYNPVAVLADLSRVTRPGGYIILGTPFNYWIHEAPHDYFRWTIHALRKLGQDAGLEIVEEASCGDTREVLADIALKRMAMRSSRLAQLMEWMFRATRFVSVDRVSNGQFTLANVVVFRRL
jgi:SAM-dependent methyltransferase